jgi:hypothetical protein
MRTVLTRLALAALALVSCLGPAGAQTSPTMAYAVPSCGQVTGLVLNEPHMLYMDQTGNLCTSGSGGGPGGTTDTVVKSTPTSRSGTITAGGTAQVLMPANASRRGYVLQNQSVGDLYINEIGTAAADQTSMRVPAGGYFTPPSQQSSTGAVSVFGATTGQAFFAREF